MDGFVFFARPWWVNLLIFVPFAVAVFWRRRLEIGQKTLLVGAIFGVAFGFVEAAVVVYIRGAAGMLAECATKLPDGIFSFDMYRQSQLLSQLPKYFLTIEMYRESATIIMLICVAWLAVSRWRERWAMLFWTFAWWDLFYYVGLKLAIDWPERFTTADVLFLLPVPWLAQVWLPIFISSTFVLIIFFSCRKA
ncbi:MAG TPA: hypothetical protein VF817_03145 [Patescibacteria group bacterium]